MIQEPTRRTGLDARAKSGEDRRAIHPGVLAARRKGCLPLATRLGATRLWACHGMEERELRSMKTLFDPAVASELRERVSALRSDQARRWGKMTPAEALCHLNDSMRIALGEIDATPVRMPLFESAAVRWLLIHRMPWPKGKLETTKDFLVTRPTGWSEDVARWNAALDRFLARGDGAASRWSPHPAFGALPGEEWGRLTWKHHDHHLRQFGA